MKVSDLVLDLRTASLTKVVSAFVQAEDVPRQTASSITGVAKSIRALAEAGEHRAAGDLAAQLGKQVENLTLEEPLLDWRKLLGRHCASVVNATGPGREVK